MKWDSHLKADREHYANGGSYRGANAKDYLVFMQEQGKLERKIESGNTLARMMSDYREGSLSTQPGRNPMGIFIIGDKVKLIGDVCDDPKYNPLWNGSQGKVVGTIEHQNLNHSSDYSCHVQWANGKSGNYKPEDLAFVYSNADAWKSWHKCTACKKDSPYGYGPTKREAEQEALLIMRICGWDFACNAEYNPQGLLDFLIDGDILCYRCKNYLLNNTL